MELELIFWILFAALILPSIGVGLSAMASGKGRRCVRPPDKHPGWRNNGLH